MRKVLVPTLLAALALWLGCAPASREPDASPKSGTLSVADSLGGSEPEGLEGFDRALEPRALVFPDDHGPHPTFKTEWWYWIGNLTTADGRRFGYQLTFFRSALAPPPGEGRDDAATSHWRTDQLYMAHLALSDIDAASFHSFERFSRGAAGLAGAAPEPFRVWLDDWSVEQESGSDRWFLGAGENGVRIELALEPGRPRVLHGDRGLSRKGDAPGAASYYYTQSRMPTRGRIVVNGTSFEVEGVSWLDREWSTSLLSADEVGWDWLGAQLDDGRDLMLFRLRRRDGSSARVDGTLIEADGSSRALRTEGIQWLPRGAWTSPVTEIRYPGGFEIELPAEALSLDVKPLLADQELRLTFVYWEGAVAIEGSATGRGYLEMTGYGERASPR